MKNIVVASDSFKGSLTSEEVAEAAAEGIRAVFPECNVTRICIADGGEGTTEALVRALGGESVQVDVHDPLMRPMKATYGITGHGRTLPDGSCAGRTAIMEMSAASGLPLLAPEERDPMKTTTFGTGEMIMDAYRRGCTRFLLGIGGSATNDAGTGMLSALGARFLDKDGNILEGTGENLARMTAVDMSGVPEGIIKAWFDVACDVDNPFCGPEGAAYIFAPQKGAGPDTVRLLDKGMESFAEMTRKVCGQDIRTMKGAGAAGGLGGALAAYLGARLVPGSEMILDAVGFDSLAAGADLVITGEGRIDRQTSMGKVPSAVLKRASALGIPVIAIAGCIGEDMETSQGFAAVFPVTPYGMDKDEAMRPSTSSANVRRTVHQIMNVIRISGNE
ncbi:MAG TPA: glycerate kinase [Candidatus Cryptobacteroides intestinipullorum]|nr:glycerate kinase [Candidatus Cryptobacteroides intestinipullorum]